MAGEWSPLENRCSDYLKAYAGYDEYPSRRTKENKKRKGKEAKTRCPWPDALNIVKVATGSPIIEELLEHQTREVELRLPGSDFSAVRLVRLCGLIRRIPSESRSSEYTRVHRLAITAFKHYRFWPTDSGDDDMIFW